MLYIISFFFIIIFWQVFFFFHAVMLLSSMITRIMQSRDWFIGKTCTLIEVFVYFGQVYDIKAVTFFTDYIYIYIYI